MRGRTWRNTHALVGCASSSPGTSRSSRKRSRPSRRRPVSVEDDPREPPGSIALPPEYIDEFAAIDHRLSSRLRRESELEWTAAERPRARDLQLVERK